MVNGSANSGFLHLERATSPAINLGLDNMLDIKLVITVLCSQYIPQVVSIFYTGYVKVGWGQCSESVITKKRICEIICNLQL